VALVSSKHDALVSLWFFIAGASCRSPFLFFPWLFVSLLAGCCLCLAVWGCESLATRRPWHLSLCCPLFSFRLCAVIAIPLSPCPTLLLRLFFFSGFMLFCPFFFPELFSPPPLLSFSSFVVCRCWWTGPSCHRRAVFSIKSKGKNSWQIGQRRTEPSAVDWTPGETRFVPIGC